MSFFYRSVDNKLKLRFHLLAKKEEKSEERKRFAISKCIVQELENLSVFYGLLTFTPLIPEKFVKKKI